MNRHHRIATAIRAALEGMEVLPYPEDEETMDQLFPNLAKPNSYTPVAPSEYGENQQKIRKQQLHNLKEKGGAGWPSQSDRMIAQHRRTLDLLRKWLTTRNIPVRVVVGSPRQVSAIGKAGVITLFYAVGNQSYSPSAWIIVHNLAHALYDSFDDSYLDSMEKYFRPQDQKKMRSFQDRSQALEEFRRRSSIGHSSTFSYSPTTRSQRENNINDPVEAMYEIFTQWVVTGKVILDPRNPVYEKGLETKFRADVDHAAQQGMVVLSYA